MHGGASLAREGTARQRTSLGANLSSMSARGEPYELFRGSFVGRERDLAEIERTLASGARLVTLLGHGGIGKTRLLHRVVARVREGGKAASICDLSSARVAADIVASVGAEAAGLALGAAATVDAASARVGRALAKKRLAVLALDNVEQITTDVLSLVAGWLAAAPQTVVLTTSRVRLGAPGEAIVRVGPLPEEEALRLFEDRIATLRHSLDDEERAVARRIVALLDGMPLAVEMAAARLCVLGANELLERLSRPLAILAKSGSDASDRHASLARVLDGSYQLLDESARRGLAELGVFVGGFGMSAAEAVFGDGAASVSIVQRLADSSLLYRVQRGARVRHVPYEVVREYALERLTERGDLDAVRTRHARHFASWGATKIDGIAALENATEALHDLVEEEPNLAAAAAFLRGRPAERETRLRVLVAVEPVRTLRGQLDEWTRDVDDALSGAPEDFAPSLVSRARLALARAHHELGRPEVARAAYDVAIEAAARASDTRSEGLAKIGKGRLLAGLGEWQAACDLFDAARTLPGVAANVSTLARACFEFFSAELGRSTDPVGAATAYIGICRRGADPRELVYWIAQLGRLESEFARDDASAQKHLHESLALARDIGDRRGEGFALFGLGVNAIGFARPDEAVTLLEDAVRVLRDAGMKRYEGWSHGFLGVAHAYREGAGQEALAAFRASIELLEEVGDAPRLAHVLASRAAVHAKEGKLAETAEDLARARALAPPESLYHAWTIDLSNGQLDVLRARQASSAMDARLLLERARDRLVRATWPRGGAAAPREWPWKGEFFEPRIAAELLERAIDGAAAPAGSLVVARDGSSMRLPSGERVDLAGKSKLMRVLAALVSARLARPGEPLTSAALFEAGWPGERVPRAAAMNRLHVALDQLRKHGLREVLNRGEGGFFLDPSVPCVWDASGS